jgi:hypothetical protein
LSVKGTVTTSLDFMGVKKRGIVFNFKKHNPLKFLIKKNMKIKRCSDCETELDEYELELNRYHQWPNMICLKCLKYQEVEKNEIYKK